MTGVPTVLYLHGLDSSPTPAKTDMIASLGFKVIAPQMHYREERNLYERVRGLASHFRPDWIVGSSLGGYTGFWLSRETGVPAILINPALHFRERDPGLVSGFQHNDVPATVFIGMEDDVVCPEDTLGWLDKHPEFSRIEILKRPSMGHQTRAEELKGLLLSVPAFVR